MTTQTGSAADPFEEQPVIKTRRRRAGGSVWWVALTATIVWVAAVASYLWGAYQLPLDFNEGIARLQEQFSTADALILAAVVVAPLMLIWAIAAIWHRSAQMRAESYMLAEAAMRLAKAAETAERRGDVLLPGPSLLNEISSPSPGHFRREVERATHAISALHAQMSAIEEALANQSATIDQVAERAETRAKAITETLRSEREAIARVADDLAIARTGAVDAGVAVNPVALGAVKAQAEAAEAHVSEASVRLASALDLAPDVKAPPVMPVAPSRDVARDSAPDPLRDIAPAAFAPNGPTKPGVAATVTAAATVAAAPVASEVAALLHPSQPAEDESVRKRQLEDLRREMADLQAREPETVIRTEDDPQRPLDPFDDLGPASDAKTNVATASSIVAGLGAGAAVDAIDSRLASAMGGPSPDTEETAEADVTPASRTLDWQKVIRASNFPDNEADHETLDALYDVLTDPQAAALLQVAEDTLATLAEIDLYMEDFRPRVSPVNAWRGFLNGKTASEAGLAGLDIDIERSRVAAKIDADPPFGALVERFIERYEAMLRRLLSEGGEPKLMLDMSDTRTGRAYLLVAEASGRLD